MLRSLSFASLLALFVVSEAASAAELVVTLAPQVEVADRNFSLGEVAQIQGEDAPAMQALRGLRVGQLGLSGRELRLTRLEIARYVERHLPPSIERVQWRGAEATAVRMNTVRMEPQAVVEYAQAKLRAYLEAQYTNLDLRPTTRLDALRIPAGEATFSASVRGGPKPQRRMRVDVELHSTNQLLRVIPVWFEVRAYANALTLARDIAVDEVLRTDDMEYRQVDVAAADGDVLVLAGDVVGQRMRRAARSGTALSRAMVGVVPAVVRQDDVEVEVRAGAVLIESRGTALSDGRYGDLVAVRIAGAELLRGRVVGAKRLALNLQEER